MLITIQHIYLYYYPIRKYILHILNIIHQGNNKCYLNIELTENLYYNLLYMMHLSVMIININSIRFLLIEIININTIIYSFG